MLDIITLKGLTASGVHGVYDFEQERSQPFLVDVSLWVDISCAVLSDCVEETVSYSDIVGDVVSIIEGPSVHLIETLADRIASRVMKRPRVEGVEVVVHKPQAPLEREFADVFVAVRRGVAESRVYESRMIDSSVIPSSHVTLPVEEVPASISLDEQSPFPWEESTPTPKLSVSDVEPRLELSQPPLTRVPAEVPSAPTPLIRGTLSLDDASVTTGQPLVNEDSVTQVVERDLVLAFGANQGNAPVTIVRAIERLIDERRIEIREISPLMRTTAVLKPGMAPQADYWNAVLVGRTTLDPHEVLNLTAGIEADLGRERPYEWAPRTIDIDLISMGETYIDDAFLQLPHPRAAIRAFVLIPWLLADPQAELPGFGSVAELLALAPDRDCILDAIDDWLEQPESVMADSDAVLANRRLPVHPTESTLSPASKPVPFEPVSIREPAADIAPEAVNIDALVVTEPAETRDSKPRIHWKPVTPTVLEEQAAHGKPAAARPLPPLPEWNFAHHEVTIIDTSDEGTEVFEPEDASEDSSRVILDPALPADVAIGPVDTSGVSAPQLQRRSTIRPTHTGMMPIIKRHTGEK